MRISFVIFTTVSKQTFMYFHGVHILVYLHMSIKHYSYLTS